MTIKNTPFKKESATRTKERQADSSYSYQGPNGDVWLSVTCTIAGKEDKEQEKKRKHDQELTSQVHLTGPTPVYVTVQTQGERITAGAVAFKHSFFDSKEYRITFKYGYPAGDTEAKETIEGILTSLK